MVKVTPPEMAVVRAMAAQWDFPGRSNIRAGEQRKATLAEDALIGQIGTYAGLKFLFGAGAYKEYLTSRWHAGRHKFESDGGSDADALNLDIKASLRRAAGRSPLDYNLAVRPRERRPAWTYILALVDPPQQDRALVHIVGWADSDMLPAHPASDGPLAGAFVLPGRSLNPLPPFNWLYFQRNAA